MKHLFRQLSIGVITCLLLVNTQTTYVTADTPLGGTTRDIILIVDTTTVMAYETGAFSTIPDSPFDNPALCNITDICQPFRAIKDSLVDYINLLSFPNDRVGVITLTSQTPGGSRNPMIILPLSSDKTAVLDAINGLKVFQPPDCTWGNPASPSKGPCINYTSENIFSGFRCPIYELGADLISGTGDEPGNPSSCTQTDIGTPLSLASSLFAQDSSAVSQKIIIPLITGHANSSQGDLNFPDGYCPESTWLSSWCNDNDPDVRHIPLDPNYDADDYARDMADLVATPNTCYGIKIFSLGIGSYVQANNGRAEKLLKYIALDAGGSSASHGMYYFVPNSVALSNVLELLATSDSCLTTTSITRVSTSPTFAASVNFTVSFSKSVQNVDVNDFSLFTTGVTGASVTSVAPVSASVYTVVVNTGTGSGTIRLDVPDTATIKDLSNNDLSGLPFITGETYTITRSGGIGISIGGVNQGNYTLTPSTSQVLKYAVDGGPVVIGSGGGPDIIASLNQWRRRPSTTVGWTGVAQSMGLPVSLITNAYYFPRYDDSAPSSLYNALLLANVDTVSRDITVTIGGIVRGTYTLAPSASQFVSYPGVVGGPVVVSSDSGAQIVASLYELIRDPSAPGWNGQSEMMGLPATSLSDQYLIPIYFGAANPQTLNASLYIANVDTIATTVDVTIAGVSRGTYNLNPATSLVVKYAVDGGPVEISSNNGANIVASLNQWRRRPSTTVGWTGVTQSMALPVALITNEYFLPRYDDSSPNSLYNALLLANVDTVSRDITVTIGGVVRGTYTIAPSQSQFVSYPGVVGGPVVISSEVGSQIVASLYELIRDPSAAGWNGQSEMMGLPASQISNQYLIPLYFGAANPNTLNASLHIAVP